MTVPTPDNEFGKYFATIRKKYAFNQAATAQLIETSGTYISDVETGRKPPFTLANLKILVDQMQVNNTERKRLFQLATKERKALVLPISTREEENSFIYNLGKMIIEAEPDGLPPELFEKMNALLKKYEKKEKTSQTKTGPQPLPAETRTALPSCSHGGRLAQL